MRILTIFFSIITMFAGYAQAQEVPIAPVAAPEVYKIIAENDQFRVIRATWQPGQADKMHSHPADRVSLFDTSCILHLTNLDGSTRTAKPKAGKARLRTGEPTKGHIAKNIGDEVCIITIVEMK